MLLNLLILWKPCAAAVCKLAGRRRATGQITGRDVVFEGVDGTGALGLNADLTWRGSAADIAATLLTLADQMRGGAPGGTYHYAGQRHTSWAGFAREIFAQAKKDMTVTGT